MILIAGGTGRLGTLVVNRLINRGLDLRVLTRDPARSGHLAGDHIAVARGDVRDRDSLGPAMAGVDVVVSAVHGFTGDGSPASTDRDGNANLIDAAKAAGAEFVMMSTVGAAADSPMELFRMKCAAELHAARSGVPTTIVRATAFLELWIDLLNQTAARSGRPLVFGRGRNPINFVSATDVAALVERVITDDDTRGETLAIGGPQNLTFDQLAQAVQTAAGRSGLPRHVPPVMLHVMAGTIGRFKPELGRQARAALVMDRVDLSYDGDSIHDIYADLPGTSLTDVLTLRASESSTADLRAP